MQGIESFEVQIPAIHDVDRSGFYHQNVEDFDVVQLAVGDMDEARDVAAQIEQRVHLDRCLGRAKRCPRKQRQAQIDGGGVERISGVLQLDAQAVAGVKLPCLCDQVLGKLGMNAPISEFVGIGQRGAFDLLTEPHVVELRRLRRETDLDVAEALAVSQLGEGHHAKLIGACHALHIAIAVVAIDDAMKGLPRQEVHELSEQRLAEVHRQLRPRKSRKTDRSAIRRSNRRHLQNLRIPLQFLVPAHGYRFNRTLLRSGN